MVLSLLYGRSPDEASAKSGNTGPYYAEFIIGPVQRVRPLVAGLRPAPVAPHGLLLVNGTYHHMFNTTLASSDIREGSQGGFHTTLTVTGPTPGTLAAAFSIMLGSSCADGQLGVVNVMSIEIARSSPISIL